MSGKPSSGPAALPGTIPPELILGEFPRYRDGAFAPVRDVVAREESFELRWPGLRPRRMWSRPGDWEDLALGHALLDICPTGSVPALTGRDSAGFDLAPLPAQPRSVALPDVRLAPEDILTRMNAFVTAPGLFVITGCYHRAGAFDPATATFVHTVEDIGRHNCLDRLAGWALRTGRDTAGLILFVSCRTTASLVQKAVNAGFPMIVTRAAPTTAGIATAEAAGLTLIGFTRPERFTVFLDPTGRVSP